MIKKRSQLSKRQKEQSYMFISAYERLSYNHKKVAKRLFCEDFGIAGGTFNNKVGGTNPVAETEVEWMVRVAENPVKELKRESIAA